MLKKLYRLSKTKDIDRVHKTGRKLFSQNLLLKYAPNDLNYSRFGVMASTKVSSKAVVRNRLKRVIRDHLRKILPKAMIGYDVLIITSKKCLDGDLVLADTVRLNLDFLFKKSGLLKK